MLHLVVSRVDRQLIVRKQLDGTIYPSAGRRKCFVDLGGIIHSGFDERMPKGMLIGIRYRPELLSNVKQGLWTICYGHPRRRGIPRSLFGDSDGVKKPDQGFRGMMTQCKCIDGYLQLAVANFIIQDL